MIITYFNPINQADQLNDPINYRCVYIVMTPGEDKVEFRPVREITFCR